MLSILPDPAHLSEQDIAQLRHAVARVRGWLDLKMKTGRYSFGLVMELVDPADRLCSVHSIYDEIGKLEGTDSRPSLTKPAERFKSGTLRGLWHKHHHQANFLAKNLALELPRSDIVENAVAPYYGRTVDEVAGEIAHAVVVGAYEQRAREGRMTGEWIVFEKVDGVNYYLTLGYHKECNEAIKARVEAYRQVDDKLAAAG